MSFYEFAQFSKQSFLRWVNFGKEEAIIRIVSVWDISCNSRARIFFLKHKMRPWNRIVAFALISFAVQWNVISNDNIQLFQLLFELLLKQQIELHIRELIGSKFEWTTYSTYLEYRWNMSMYSFALYERNSSV